MPTPKKKVALGSHNKINDMSPSRSPFASERAFLRECWGDLSFHPLATNHFGVIVFAPPVTLLDVLAQFSLK
jgi:hypothetical protein